VQRLAEEQAGEPLVDEDGAVAIVPVEGEQAALAGLLAGDFGAEFAVRGAVALADDLDPPFEDVADGGLAGLDAVKLGEDGALDDAADAGDVGHGLLGGDDAAVAGRGADDLDERALVDAAADGAVVHVEFADGDGDAGGQAEFLGPFRAKFTGGGAGIVGLGIKAVAQVGEGGIEECEEFLVGQAAPFGAVHGLVAGGAHAAFHLKRIGHAGEHGRDPVAELDPGIGGFEDLGRDVTAVPELRPPPLG